MRVLLLVLLATLLLPPSPSRAERVDLGLRLGPGFTYESLRLALPGMVEVRGKVAPDGSSADLTGTLRDPARAMVLAGVDGSALADLGPVDFDLKAQRAGEAIRLDLALRPRRFAPWSIRVNCELRGDTLDARASLRDGQGTRAFLHIAGDADAARLTLDLGGSGALHGTAHPRDASLRLSGDGLKLAPLLGLLRDLPAFDLPPGSLSGLADVKLSAAAPDRLELDLGLRHVALSAAQGRVMSEQLAVNLRARSNGQATSLEVTAPTGQVLAGNWFADLAASPPSLALSRQGEGPARATLRLGELASANLEMRGGQGSLTATVSDLGKAFDTLVKQALLAASPLVSQAEAAGATSLRADLRLDKNGRLVAQGRVEADALGFQAPDVEVRGASLDLPFHWREGGARGRPMPPLPRDWGGFSARAAALGPVSLQSDVPLALVPGRLYVGGFRAAVPGGAVESPGLHVDRPFSPVRVLRGSLRLPGLDFAALPSPFPLEGSLSGSLDLRLEGGRLTTEGKLGGGFFGGRLTVSDIGGRDLFQSGRNIGLNARVEGMDLLPLGRAMDLGTITGRLDLMLRGLEIAYGQPVAFELVARSPGEARADRRISLKAVNALTELGTGRGMTGVGVGFFSSFFETFAYRDMGLYCRLRNDLFTVRGLIQEGGVEYIIKRPPLFGINVVNSNPGNTIRFSDMLDRLGRVLRGLDKEDS